MDSVRRAEAGKHNERRLEIIILCIHVFRIQLAWVSIDTNVGYNAAKISVIANFRPKIPLHFVKNSRRLN